ncbi:30S ribosomal protein S6e [Candidatus Micrarchaeota archaeon CG10_big_fil_rev_8_21_14_0_10_59_7]|nr:MAG: 30S ribosomal protein S6e [Candidatus Micrarchaeota archaeon CG10_big_fil_rev_8_21_14_0_10_59_7]
MKIVFSEKGGQSFQKEIEKAKESQLYGKTIGEKFDGGIIGLEGYTLEITGGSNREGTPMRKDVKGMRKTKAILGGGAGVRGLHRGQKIKKTVAGNTVGEHTMQLNAKIAEAGSKQLADLGFTPKAKEAKPVAAEEKKK